MLRHAHQSQSDEDWTLVTAKCPCRVCGATEGCRNGYEGQYAACLRRHSQWPLAPGGWVHQLEVRVAARPAPQIAKDAARVDDASMLAST
jgi:hypothetical protein